MTYAFHIHGVQPYLNETLVSRQMRHALSHEACSRDLLVSVMPSMPHLASCIMRKVCGLCGRRYCGHHSPPTALGGALDFELYGMELVIMSTSSCQICTIRVILAYSHPHRS